MTSSPTDEKILAGLNDAVLILGPDHCLVKINPAGEALLNRSAKHLLGTPIDQLLQFENDRLNHALSDENANMSAKQVFAYHGKHEIGLIDFKMYDLASDTDWRVISLHPTRQNGFAREQASEETNQATFKAPDILGHEIKNPLAAIKGAAQLLQRTIEDNQKPLTDIISSEVDRVAGLLDRMQTLSSTQPAQIRAVNIHSLIDQARQSTLAASKDAVSIHDEYDPSLPDVLVDPEAMMQVLTNILANAVDATRILDSPEIRITTRYSFGASFSTQGENSAVRLPIEIVISDNGPGVPVELEREIFSPFVTNKTDGQGLGLALVKKLIADMNGRIRYHRDQDTEMSRFTIFLPLAASKK